MNKSALWITMIVVLVVIIGGFLLFRDNPAPEPEGLDDIDITDNNLETDSLGEPGIEDEDILLEDEAAPLDDTQPVALPGAALPTAPEATAAAVNSNAKEFTITGQNYSFSLAEIRVSQGDTVRINFSSTGGLHDWVVDKFNAATDRVNTGQTASVEFIADQTGTFQYYCSVGNHRAMGMIGQLIVE